MAGLADAEAVIIALDGKTVRGARAGQDKAPHLLAAMICGARVVLAQKDVDQKTNESYMAWWPPRSDEMRSKARQARSPT